MSHLLYPWDTSLLVLFIIANLTIAMSFLFIPLVLMRTRVAPHQVVLLRFFGIFVFLCGISHALRVFVLFNPGWFIVLCVVDACTAVASTAAAVAAWYRAERLVEIPPNVLEKEVKEIRERVKQLAAATG